ncbi:hypothetical protein [Paenibacillus zanthoxyli]|uniref:hypothetical protein n=1 Tax=Paenibacillus zanthoxyli TaxID=369399 RepID=UPI0004713838|nr:hypothetical protein [Paenibacillus zanthoxyli]
MNVQKGVCSAGIGGVFLQICRFFQVNFARKEEIDARVQLFEAYTPKRGEGVRNASAFAGTGPGSDFLREIDIQMQEFFETSCRSHPPCH